MDLDSLLNAIRAEYRLLWDGIHGIAHWTRVCENGLRLAEQTGAQIEIVECFAYLHDSKRINDGRDPGHGRRGAALARSFQGTLLDLTDEQIELLAYACTYHTDGMTAADVTVQTCWDADRLDLGRVGKRPRPELLCTPAARDPATIEWAWKRSQTGEVHILLPHRHHS